MTHLQKSILATGIALALGSVGSAWANPQNYANDADIHGDNTQSATATSTQGGDGSPQANEFSEAWSEDHSSANAFDAAANNHSTASSDRSDHSDHSDHSDNSEAFAEDYGVAANNHSTATNSSSASADDSAANNGSTANSDRSANAEDDAIAANNGSTVNQDNSYASVSGTGAAANGGGNATYTDSHDVDNSEAYAPGDYAAAANNGGTAEVHMAVATSTLQGTVTGNTTTFNNPIGLGAASYTANNSADGGVSGASGVINFSQNTGQNALTQQSVSTQASLTVN